MENKIKQLQMEVNELKERTNKLLTEQEEILHKLTMCQLDNLIALNRKEGK